MAEKSGGQGHIIAVVGAIVSVAAAFATILSVYYTHKAHIDDERPYILTAITSTTTQHGGERVDITVSNAGKTPAVGIKTLCVFTPRDDLKGANTHEVAFIAADKQPLKLDCEISDELGIDDKPMFRGLVMYQDIYHHRYQTPFCWFERRLFPLGTAAEKIEFVPCASNDDFR